MSFENLKLPGEVIFDLYKKTELVITTGEISDQIPPVKIKSLGGFKKNILLLVNYEDVPVIADDDLEFLQTVLSACSLSLDDVLITNFNKNQNPEISKYLKENSFNMLIAFGVDSSDLELALRFPDYQVQHHADKTYLTADPLNSFVNDRNLKGKLWLCLKKIFNI